MLRILTHIRRNIYDRSDVKINLSCLTLFLTSEGPLLIMAPPCACILSVPHISLFLQWPVLISCKPAPVLPNRAKHLLDTHRGVAGKRTH
jgi:hypothetical protein